MVLAGEGDTHQTGLGRRQQERAEGRVKGAVGDVEDAGAGGGRHEPGVQPGDGRVVDGAQSAEQVVDRAIGGGGGAGESGVHRVSFGSIVRW